MLTKLKASPKVLSLILLLLIISIFVTGNVASQLATEKFGLKLDLTENKLYDFSPSTILLTEALSEEVAITVFASFDDYPAMLREVLERYTRLSPKLTLRYTDPYQNPLAVDVLKQRGFTVETGDVIIEGQKRAKQLKMTDLLLLDSTGENVTGLQAEGQLDAALLYITSQKTPRVVFTHGHNERPTTALHSVFENSGYQLSNISLSVEELSSSSADILVIASPQRDFETAEINRLASFMNGGGSLMLFLEPSLAGLPNLEGFLADWNISVNNNVVFEERLYTSDNPLNVVPGYGVHPINSFFKDNRFFPVMPQSTSFELMNTQGSAISVAPLLLTSEYSYAKKSAAFDNASKQAEDQKGPFKLAVAAERQISSPDGPVPSRLFAAGSRSMYGDDVLGMTGYANRDFISQAIGWCNEEAITVTIPPKSLTSPPIPIMLNEALIWGAFLVILLPALVLILGAITFIKRRRL